MAARTITISYGGTNIVMSKFNSDSLPRTTRFESNIQITAAGLVAQDGPAQASKYFWQISVLMPKANAEALESLFRSWDAQRALGNPGGLTLQDGTFGSTVTTNVVFVTPPQFTKVGETDVTYAATFSVIEA